MLSRAEQLPRPFDSASQRLLVSTIKGLAMDAVEQAKSGHPGMPMGAADMASVLWTRFMVHDPATPTWPDRDRFVLSAGHGSMLLYSLLHLSGYALELGDLQRFRQLDSKTPGHPEFGHTEGVEVTTGPLGTGFAAGVGMAIAERFLAERYNRPGHAIVDHFTYGIVSDGDLMEGIASEAASLAGHLGLGKLVYLYDDNRITIDGGTELSFGEDVGKRFAAYGWHVQHVDGHDPTAVATALEAARREHGKPSLIACRTTIGHGAPNLAGTSKTHGAPLGAAEVAAAKAAMKWPETPFHVPDDVRKQMAALREQLGTHQREWQQRFEAYRKAFPQEARELEAAWREELPAKWAEALPKFEVGASIATRKASEKILTKLFELVPTLVGGSADLAESNGVAIAGATSCSREQPAGRILHFGVREHGMAGICNGIALHGGMRVFDATFLIFSDFMRGALRLSALMRLPVVHVFSHDSVWVGEDGPTHQPIEQLMSLRLIPDLHVVRPADANECVGAWVHAMTRKLGAGPTAILVSRQGLPVMSESQRDVSRGAYVLWEAEGKEPLDGVLIATGSEVSLCRDAAVKLRERGRRVRVVSMPCWEAFEEQPEAYRAEVLPPGLERRLAVEAGRTLGWDRYARHQHGIDRFGASAPGAKVAEALGFTVDAVVEHYLALR